MRIIASLLLLFTSMAPGSATVASHPAADPNTASPNAATLAFGRLKRLAGEWEARAPKTYGNAVIQLHYRLISDDSVLVETFKIPEQDVEMLTVYHTDGKQLVLTHYCAVNNQVRMVADLGAITGPAAPIPSITFDFRDGSNLDASHLQVMNRLRVAFDDDTRITQTWRWRDHKSPTGEDTAVYSYTRVR